MFHTIQFSQQIWTPSQISTSAWYDASDTSTITESGGAVSEWRDKSGSLRHISQGSASAQPTLGTDVVQFNGTTDYLWNSLPFMYANGELDVYVAGAINNTSDDRLLCEGSSTNNNPIYAIAQTDNSDASKMSSYIRNDANQQLAVQPDLSASGAFDDTLNLYQWRDTGSMLSGRVNGGTETSSGYTRSGTFTTDRFAMGTVLRSGTSAFIDADINEVIMTDNLSDADRQKVEGYLAWKWGLSSSLPSSHPYKNRPPSA
jgi:hypothetical protein